MSDRELTQLQETGCVRIWGPVRLSVVLEGLNTLGIDLSKILLSTRSGGLQVTVLST